LIELKIDYDLEKDRKQRPPRRGDIFEEK